MKQPIGNLPAFSPLPASPLRPSAPLWAFALAILLGALGALLAPLAHVHPNGHEAYAHQHFFLGPHSHPHGPGSPASREDPERDGATVALAAAIVLTVVVPDAVPAAAPDFLAAPALSRHPALRLAPAAPGSPRGPPSTPSLKKFCASSCLRHGFRGASAELRPPRLHSECHRGQQ